MRDTLRMRAAARAASCPDEELLAWAAPRYFYHVNPDHGGALVVGLVGPERPTLDRSAPSQGAPSELLDWLSENTQANRHKGNGRYMVHARRGHGYVVAFGENLREALHGAKALWQE